MSCNIACAFSLLLLLRPSSFHEMRTALLWSASSSPAGYCCPVQSTVQQAGRVDAVTIMSPANRNLLSATVSCSRFFSVGVNTSAVCTGYFIFRPNRQASTSSWLCLSTDACMVWRHGTFPTTSSSSLILTAAVSGRRHPCSWRSDVHGCPLSAIVRFRWPDAAFETVCHLISRQLQRSLFFFGIASRHTSSQDHFLHNS